MKFLLIGSVLMVTPLCATTYYVDSVSGADTNNGTSTSTPWSHSPGMNGCSANCSSKAPAPGDQFIFKGGSTWTAGSLPLNVSTSGQSGNNIYFGVSTSWYSGSNAGTVNTNGTEVYWGSGNAFYYGGAWDGGSIAINGKTYTIAAVQGPYSLTLTTTAGTQNGVAYSNSLFKRPIFNGQGLVTNLIGASQSYITIDSLELTGVMMTTSTNGLSVYLQATHGNELLENLDVHNWNRCTGTGAPTSICTSAVTDNSGSEGGIYAGLFSGLSGVNMALQYSNVGNPENGSNIGACTRGVQTLVGNYLHDCSQACLHGCQLVHDNVVYNVGKTFDNTTHTNVFYADCFDGQCSKGLASATAYLYNNWIMDSQGNSAATGGAAYPNPGTSGTSSSVTYYVFNNVVSCNTGNGCATTIGDEIDPYNATGQVMNVYDWNNTYNLTATGTCVNVVSRAGTTNMNIVDARNLQCIVPSGGTIVTFSGTLLPTTLNPLLQTVSAANTQGYFLTGWNPTLGSGGTVLAGKISVRIAPGPL